MKNVTVSLTSYPARIRFVPRVIRSLVRQTVSPARIVLYLAVEEFPDREGGLPAALQKQAEKGFVKIHWCPLDLKPHKKYFYAMREYPDDVIITADDDMIYPPAMLEELLSCRLKFPNAVIARRTHLIRLDDKGKILPYMDWTKRCDDFIGEPVMRLTGVGCAGILYPPHALPQEAFNADAIMENALYTDDLWLKAFTAVRKIPVVLAVKKDRTRRIRGTKDTALYYHNKLEGGNDEALKKIAAYLDILYDSHDVLPSVLLSDCMKPELSEVPA